MFLQFCLIPPWKRGAVRARITMESANATASVGQQGMLATGLLTGSGFHPQSHSLKAAMGIDLLPDFLRQNYEVHEWKHACAILRYDFPKEWQEVVATLTEFRLRRSWIMVGGGNKSKISEAIDSELYRLGWTEKQFATEIVIDGYHTETPTHQIDCFKNRIALEIEWNNKDPFFDRDLNNFRLLFELRAVSVGVIITRCDDLQTIFKEIGRGASYGASTTHMSKLLPRLAGGGGGGCPILVFGISKSLYLED